MDNTTAPTPNKAILLFSIIGTFSISSFGVLGSSMAVAAIASSKKLRSPCFALIAGSSVGSLVVAAHFLSRAFDQVGLYAGIFPSVRSGLFCLVPGGLLGLWGISFHALISFCIACDRLISILIPNRYRLWGKRYSSSLLAACVCFITAQGIIGLVTAKLNSRVNCNLFAALNQIYMFAFLGFNAALSIVTVVAYCAMWMVFRYKYKQISARTAETDPAMKRQLAVMPTIKLMALLYLATGILSELLVHAAMAVPPGPAALVLINMGTVLKNASSLVEVFALIIRNKTFRESCKAIMWKPNATAPATTSQAQRPPVR